VAGSPSRTRSRPCCRSSTSSGSPPDLTTPQGTAASLRAAGGRGSFYCHLAARQGTMGA
jgi:hypothetical protein